MLVGSRRGAVNAHALVASDVGGARLRPRLLTDGRYALPEAALTDPAYAAAASVLSGWSVETPTDYATITEQAKAPLFITVDGKQMFTAGRRAALTMPHDDVFRFEVRANDFASLSDSTNKNRRCEIISHQADGVGAATVWTAFSVILGAHPGLSKTTHGIVTQWHSVDTSIARAPILSVNYASDGLKIRTASSASLTGGSGNYVVQYTTTRPAAGVKTHFVMQATFGELGHLNAWVNGTQVVNVDAPIGYYTDLTDGSGRTILGYPHFGLYTANQPDTDIVYIANPEWGTADLSARIATPLPVPDLTW